MNEQANTDEGNTNTAAKGKVTEVLKDTVKGEVEETKKKETIQFTPPKIVKNEKVQQKKTVRFTPPVIVKDKEQAPPPPPTKTTIKFISPEGEEEKTPPPPPVKVPDLSSYKVGDKFIDSNGHEWIVESINPPKFKTNPPKKD